MTSVISESPPLVITDEVINNVIYGISSILKMFKVIGQEQFPRNIMTATSNGFFTVETVEELYTKFKEANFMDCRISAYPPVVDEYIDDDEPSSSLIPNLVLLDFDYNSDIVKAQGIQAANEESRDKVNTILRNLDSAYNITNIMVLHTGNGRHVIVPFLFDIPFESLSEFRKYIPLIVTTNRRNNNTVISTQFLSFAKKYLSLNQADQGNYPTFKSIMLRVPGTFNAKQKFSNNYEAVKIEYEWSYDATDIPKLEDLYEANNSKSLIYEFLHHMNIYVGTLQQRLIKYENKRNKKSKSKIEWIEVLHKTPLLDCRKRLIWLVFSTYCINIRNMTHNDAFIYIKEWTDKCNIAKELDFDVDEKIDSYLDKAEINGYRPISFEKLETYGFTTASGIKLHEYLNMKMGRDIYFRRNHKAYS